MSHQLSKTDALCSSR